MSSIETARGTVVIARSGSKALDLEARTSASEKEKEYLILVIIYIDQIYGLSSTRFGASFILVVSEVDLTLAILQYSVCNVREI